MYKNKKVVVVLPAYNAALTIKKTFEEIPHDLVDEIILCDDASKDDTVKIARSLGIQEIISHTQNKGYGGNQKSLYKRALELDADIIIMLHPHYQYTPKLIPPMVNILGENLYDVVLGSRILGKGALKGGMPIYKYFSNRFLTFIQNLLVNHKLSEYHTGYRAFTREVLENINLEANSDDFVFDNEMLSQIIYKDFLINFELRNYSYSGLSKTIDAFKNLLCNQYNCKPGERILIGSQAGLVQTAFIFAAAELGLVIVVVDYQRRDWIDTNYVDPKTRMLMPIDYFITDFDDKKYVNDKHSWFINFAKHTIYILDDIKSKKPNTNYLLLKKTKQIITT